MKKTLICIDRDGTLIYDSKEHLFLGKDDEWQSKVRLLPFVCEGLKLLNTIPDAAIYMVTNQAGVAISDYPELTLERAHEVCLCVIDRIKNLGAHIDGYFLCPHATIEYMVTKPEVKFDPRLVHEKCGCLKPSLGMVFNALKAENITPSKVELYFIGDRMTDVQTALNINGTGILIPFKNEDEEEKKTKVLDDQAHIQIFPNLLVAAQWIVKWQKIKMTA